MAVGEVLPKEDSVKPTEIITAARNSQGFRCRTLLLAA